MKLLTEVMRPYFDEKVEKDFLGVLSGQGTPITVVSNEWERVTDPNRLSKKYEFNDHAEYANFLMEILSYEHESDHFGKIICEYPQIVIEVYTHDVNDVTERDLEYARTADLIRQDVSYYKRGNDEF